MSTPPPSAPSSAAHSRSLDRGVPVSRFRPELHGVRGVAILGVVLFHIFGGGRVSGGIDIFLAISGFLFTAMLLREAASRGGRISLARYLARLARRILPPAVVAVAVTTMAGLLILPSTQHHQMLTEARAALLYFENIELVASQLAYEAAGPGSSPFQHFWSLSVQGQFYLLWPILAVLSVLVARALRRPAIQVMTVCVSLVLIASLAYALLMQQQHQEAAYLMTRTRMWELAFGGLLALLGARLTLPRRLRGAAGWTGLLLILSCGFVLDGAALFPGPWALWPLLGLALVLASAGPEGGQADPATSATRLLSTRPLAWVGNIAYGLYLWHWPLLIFHLELSGRDQVGVLDGMALVALSLLAGWATFQGIERRTASGGSLAPRVPLTAAAGSLAIGAAVTTIALIGTTLQLPEGYSMAGADRQQHPGAAVTVEDADSAPAGAEMFPGPELLAADRPQYYTWDCRQPPYGGMDTAEVLICEDPDPPPDPSRTVMITGGSHAGQWHHAWMMLSDTYGWELIIADKSGCRLQSTENAATNACAAWNENLIDAVAEREPDLVVTPGTVMDRDGEFIVDSAPERWEEIVDTGAELLLMRGTPRPSQRVADCLAEGGTPLDCGGDPAQIAETDPLEVQDMPQGVHTVDLTEHICPERTCDAVVGNVPVWYDGSHLSTYYVETLAPILEDQLQEEIPELFR
ncbi:acyltransferase family protein [Nesterenkonia xinjiangensis]|uniref:Peptidoglycan/LPS O-acetylase OafA/YrhL n=1 Tax=Nesterenkonia xinjiangensis TaxID=225327 RepID=A0A7Z0GPF2_9MICC|nr:acyltransferase family protein [Nesterenkonia xinjiangensis]NYJ79721.1 peptidoglycan/LPS O-acetylase OafA/YrhL [Nesterenkonia xinjiangensis]